MKINKIIMALCLLFVVLVFAKYFMPAPLKTFHASNLTYINAQSSIQDTGPIKIGHLSDIMQAKSLLIDFDFKTFAMNDGNIYQIGNSVSAMRMELGPLGLLTFIYGQNAKVTLADHIQPNTLYHIHLYTDFSDNLIVKFQDKETIVQHDQLAKLAYDFSDFMLGTGFMKLRPLQGEIHHFTVSLTYTQKTVIHRIIDILLGALISVMGVLILFQAHWFLPNKSSFHPQTMLTILAYTGWGLSLSLTACLLVNLGHGSYWIPHCVFLLSYFALLFLPAKLRTTLLDFVQKNRRIFGFIALTTLLVFCIRTTPLSFHHYYHFSLYIILVLTIVIPLFIVLPVASNYTRLRKYFPMGLLLVGLELLAWMSLFDLPNWVQYVDQIKTSYLSLYSGLIALFITLLFVFSEKSDHGLQRSRIKGAYYGIDLLALCLFLWLSFRCDTLFLGSSELHWEYFTGPIRALKQGGWLLWDTPSQYGFLNIFLASLLPIKSSWQSMYVFQGLLLSITAITWYCMALKYAKNSLLNRIVAFLLIVSGLFFADPDLIGPALYPSSSVVRFFWCYILISCFLWVPRYRFKHAMLITVLWILAVFWSTESAVYATTILFSALMAQFSLDTRIRHGSSIALFARYFMPPLAGLLCSIAALVLFYQLCLGHAPDWHCFSEHALSYGSGFGSTKLKWNGPIVFLALLFIGQLHVYMRLGRPKPNVSPIPIAAMMGCLWAITTYYIGRSVANNITAILPILGFMTYFVLLIIKEKALGYYPIIAQFTAVPLLFLLIMTPLSPNGLNALLHTQSLTPDIESQLLPSQGKNAEELSQLMLKMKITPNSLVGYYGANAAMPTVYLNGGKFVNDHNWLPAPLQLMEEPIAPERRVTYLKRYVAHHKAPGFLIQQQDESSERFKEWLAVIRQFYQEDGKVSGQHYTIRHFSPK